MSRLKTDLSSNIVESLGVYQAATLDGYWEKEASKDIQYIYLLGQLKATESLHKSQGGGNHTRLRIKAIKSDMKNLGVRLREQQ